MEEPLNACSKTEKLAPSLTNEPSTENDDPMRTNDRTEVEDPMLCRPYNDKLLLAFKKERRLKLEPPVA
jgi:hypothetical protein